MHLKIPDMDMLHGSLAGKLLLFTLPIALSSMVQQLFNAADTAVAGHFGSANALAAVGTNTEIIALIVTVSSGLSIGANVLIAKHVGRNEAEKLPAAVQTAMRLAMCIGVIGLLLGQIAAAPLLRLIRTPEEIFDAAALYLRIYMLGYPFLLLYDFGAACLRARGDSRYPFLALLLSGLQMWGSTCCSRQGFAWALQALQLRRIFPPCSRRFWCCVVWQRMQCFALLSSVRGARAMARGAF